MGKPNFGCLGTRTCILNCMAGAIITTIRSATSVFSLSTRATKLIFRRKLLLQTRAGSNLHRKGSSRFGASEVSNRPQRNGRLQPVLRERGTHPGQLGGRPCALQVLQM